MDKPSGSKKCLPIASGSPPRQIYRPDRYEVDDTPLSPPGSNYLLFDSSKLFSSHTHKYRLLIKNNSKDDLPSPGPSKADDQKPLGQRRSKSLVSLPSLDTTATPLRYDSGAVSRRVDVPNQDYGGATAQDERELEQFLSSKHLSRRSSSDSFIPDIGANLEESYLLPYYQHSHRKEAVGGIDKLSRDFQETVAVRENEPVSFQVQPFEETEDSMSSEQGASATPEKKSSLSSSTEDLSSQEPEYVVKEVQPEPRRLFGFGPLYRPLPEVVVEKQQPLTERIRKEGIRAKGADMLDAPPLEPHRKASASKETSMWMPFSF